MILIEWSGRNLITYDKIKVSNGCILMFFFLLTELGGWKYRVRQEEDGGGNGWTHDFTFYAYPAQ